MQFPDLIERLPAAKRGPARLDWMLKHAGLCKLGSGSLRRVAHAANLDASTLYKSIDRGYFTYETAKVLETTFGTDLLDKERLMEPMAKTQRKAQV